MAEIKIKSKDQSNVGKKPRVFFTCHADDFDKYFCKVCDDIFKTHDCAIYYTENMTEVISDEDKELDIGRSNLMVIPVTYKLLNTSNRTMDSDLPYALESHIPVLPIMMEPHLDALYSRSDKFGEMQYLNPFSGDKTEIAYEKKLKKFLDAVIISDETANRIRAAFDAYIFLSYRKKDRKYANELMKLIHANPELRDVAVWYDEFLTPGESFKENISKILNDSKLFTLLVTPNLLEEPDGKPNFVMGNEYPMAKKIGIDILPAEMELTDKSELQKKYADIPECIDPHVDALLKESLLRYLKKLATEKNDNVPEHNFLIGLAYFEGIDVEVDRKRGIELITKAAEAGLIEAVKKLVNIYQYDFGEKLNHNKVIYWQSRLVKLFRDQLLQKRGDEIDFDELMEYINSLLFLGVKYNDVLSFDHAMETYRDIVDLAKVGALYLGVNSAIITAAAYNNMATILSQTKRCSEAITYQLKAIALREKALKKMKKIAPVDLINELMNSYINAAIEYDKLGLYKNAFKMLDKAEKHYNTFEKYIDTTVLARLYKIRGSVLYSIRELSKALVQYETAEKIYKDKQKYADESSDAEYAGLIYNSGICYIEIGDYNKAEEALKKAEKIYRKLSYIDTVGYLDMLINTYYELAIMYRSLNRTSEALTVIGEAERLFSFVEGFAQKVPFVASGVYKLKGDVLVDIKDFEKGLTSLKKAEDILKTEKLTPESATDYFNLYNALGRVCYHLHMNSACADYYEKAFNIHQTFFKWDKSKRNLLGILYFNYALYCYHNLYDKASARFNIDKAIKILTYLPDENDICLKALEFKRKYLGYFN